MSKQLNNIPSTAMSNTSLSDIAFLDVIFKPSTIAAVWSKSKPKQAVLEHFQQHFRPRNTYDPERVDYNCLNIFAEFQTYNLEFCKNQLYLTDRQCANALDLFWKLLEFDPDLVQTERTTDAQFSFIEDGNDQSEEIQLGLLLKRKVEIIKQSLDLILAHADEGSRITPEQARRIIKYTEATFFKHISLYDYMLKNTKLSIQKYISVPKAQPIFGQSLNAALVLEDKITRVWFEPENEPIKATGGETLEFETFQIPDEPQRQVTIQQTIEPESSDIGSERISSALDNKTLKIITRTVKAWNTKIDGGLQKTSSQPDLQSITPSNGLKKK